jgi:hypothetical protein
MINLFSYLSIYLSIHQFIHPSIHLPIFLSSIYLSIYVSIEPSLLLYPSVLLLLVLWSTLSNTAPQHIPSHHTPPSYLPLNGNHSSCFSFSLYVKSNNMLFKLTVTLQYCFLQNSRSPRQKCAMCVCLDWVVSVHVGLCHLLRHWK